MPRSSQQVAFPSPASAGPGCSAICNAAAVERHFALLGEAISAQNGVLFKTIGDAVQAAFPTAQAAVTAAFAAQSALRVEDWGDLGQLRVRMAVHIGEATPRDGDYVAPCLNRLARLLAVGYGEQILLSEAARALADAALPPGCDLLDLGSHRLRDCCNRSKSTSCAVPVWS